MEYHINTGILLSLEKITTSQNLTEFTNGWELIQWEDDMAMELGNYDELFSDSDKFRFGNITDRFIGYTFFIIIFVAILIVDIKTQRRLKNHGYELVN